MFNFDKIYEIHEPNSYNLPILMTSSHSGRSYPDKYIEMINFSLNEIRVFEDNYIDRLYDFATNIGCKLMVSNIPRAIIDLNRSKKEIDEKMFFNFENISNERTAKVKSGIGLFPKLRGTRNIYREKLDWKSYKKLIHDVYEEWHSRLEEEIYDIRSVFSEIAFIDCHSMPSYDLEGKILSDKLPEFVIGDLWGESSKNEITNFIKEHLKKNGFNVSINNPYAVAYTLKKYGNQRNGINAIQLEIRKDLYLDERNLLINQNFKEIKKTMMNLIKNLSVLLLDMNAYQKSAE